MNKKVLLIADDDEMNRKVIRRFLSNVYEIEEAVDGEETLQIMEDHQIDALLLDIIMPKIDGLEVLERIRKNPKYENMGVLVATSTKEKTERSALSLGADDIVAKPYDPIVIKKRLENILLMKEVKAQKELLQNQDMKALEETIHNNYKSEIEGSIEKIRRMTDIIRKNKGNVKLVMEMADSIEQEVNHVDQVFQ